MEAGDNSPMDVGDFHSRAGECSVEELNSVTEKDEFVKSQEGSLEEEVEEEELALTPESRAKQQQLLKEFDAVHDEAQQLRIMNLLLQCRVRRFMQQRLKIKGALSSAFFTSPQTSPSFGETAVTPEDLEKELLQAGEVRRQLQAETQRGAVQEELRQRLASARQQVAERAAQLQQLQHRLLQRLQAPPARRQEAERMLKRVWPQMLRLRKERLLHSRSKHELESAQQEVASLEVFGPQRTVAQYEEMVLDGGKLAQREQERREQLAQLRSAAERELQQAAHLREALQGAQRAILEARRRDVRATLALRSARQKVEKTQKKHNDLYEENKKLNREMELLAYPELLRDHEEVRRRLRVAEAELEKLRSTYNVQEARIATARQLMQQREQALREAARTPTSESPFHEYCVDDKGHR